MEVMLSLVPTGVILAAFAGCLEAEGFDVYDPDEALRYLIEEDAVRLTFRWTELGTAARALDVTLAVAKHEIEDGDPKALVGEVWSSRTSVVPKETT